MPNATNVVPDYVKLGLIPESTWGTTPTLKTGGSAETPLLIPVDAPDMKEEIAHIVDEGLRGLLARDFEAYGGMRQVTGSLGGIFYGASGANAIGAGLVDGDLVVDNTRAAISAHILKAFFGSAASTQIGSTGNYIHDFYVAEYPGSITLVLEDSLTGNSTTPHYVGSMLPRLTLRYNGGEGLLTWEADVLGMRQQWPASPTSLGVDKAGLAFIGWQSSSHFGAAAANPTALAKVLSAEIVMEREVTLVMGAANQQYPNIRAARPPRVTFTAVVEFSDYADYKLYSNDTDDYTANQQAWTFRFGHKAVVARTWAGATAQVLTDFVQPVTPNGFAYECTTAGTTAVSEPTWSTTLGGTTADGTAVWTTRQVSVTTRWSDASFGSSSLGANDAVFDVRIHTVSYGESALTIARGEVPNTLEFAGRALYTPSPTWLGVTPPAAARTGQSLIQMRLLNRRVAAY